jgi:STE24 endopeptidase
VLKGHFDQETFEKSQRYGKDKAKFSFVSGIYRQCIESALIHFDFYPWAWTAAGKLVLKLGYGGEVCAPGVMIARAGLTTSLQITQSIFFVGLLYFASAIPTLPLSVYSTFVLEEKHGFNKTTPGLFVADTVKGWLIGSAIGAPFLAGFLKIFKWAGDRFVPWLMGFM